MRTRDTPVLFAMPQGLGVNGVVSWAVRLANALADRGWPVAMAVHRQPPAHRRIDLGVDSRLRMVDLTHLPPPDAPGAPLGPAVAAYRDAIEAMGAPGPAIVLPSLEAGCYAIAAALTAGMGERVRLIGWQHSDNAFDPAMLAWYEPALAAIAGVSTAIAHDLRRRLAWRAADVAHVPYGVEVATEPPAPRRPGPIDLLYPGRMEHEARRVGVLCELAHELQARGTPHSLTLIGDGPAAAEVDQRLDALANARRLEPLGRSALRRRLAEADALVLTSRYEGLNIAMLEAMGAGVAPIVTRVRSGAADAIDDGVGGVLVDAGRDEDERVIAHRMADAIAPLARNRPALDAMRLAAWERARRLFSIGAHADACEALFAHALGQPARWWPPDRSLGMTSSGGNSAGGSVPPDAPQRAARALADAGVGEVPIAVYGSGRHTLALAPVLAHANVACVIDDDPARWGGRLWGWPIVKPAHAAALGVRTVLISSHIHQSVMAERCAGWGLRAITLYAPPADGQQSGTPRAAPGRPQGRYERQGEVVESG